MLLSGLRQLHNSRQPEIKEAARRVALGCVNPLAIPRELMKSCEDRVKSVRHEEALAEVHPTEMLLRMVEESVSEQSRSGRMISNVAEAGGGSRTRQSLLELGQVNIQPYTEWRGRRIKPALPKTAGSRSFVGVGAGAENVSSAERQAEVPAEVQAEAPVEAPAEVPVVEHLYEVRVSVGVSAAHGLVVMRVPLCYRSGAWTSVSWRLWWTRR